jgi:hypothetical protein
MAPFTAPLTAPLTVSRALARYASLPEGSEFRSDKELFRALVMPFEPSTGTGGRPELTVTLPLLSPLASPKPVLVSCLRSFTAGGEPSSSSGGTVPGCGIFELHVAYSGDAVTQGVTNQKQLSAMIW